MLGSYRHYRVYSALITLWKSDEIYQVPIDLAIRSGCMAW